MKEVSSANFGLLVAYLVPGFALLWGIRAFSETVQSWLGTGTGAGPTVGGFLYVTIGAVGAGMLVSLVRWAVVDQVHQRTGLRHPGWDFSQLQSKLPAFNAPVELHYRYYQFYANMLVALSAVYLLQRLAGGLAIGLTWRDAACVGFGSLLFAGSRDALRKYYERVGRLLGIEETPEEWVSEDERPETTPVLPS